MKTSLVEHEELGLRPDVYRVGYAGEPQVVLSPLRYRAGVEPVPFLCYRVYGIGDQAKSLVVGERVDPEPRGVRHEQHIGLVNGRPAPQARRVKPESLLKTISRQLIDGEGEVMPRSDQ